MSFTNKVVLVTGGSSGIGAATAVLYAKEGANVAIVGRNETKLKVTVAKCEEYRCTPLVINGDVSKEEDNRRIIKETIDRFGKLDILVNNAGVAPICSILDDNVLNVFDEVVNTNLRGIVHLTYLAAPHLIKTKGNIVNVSSIGGKKVIQYPVALYSASKAALDHYSRGAALELAPHGVRVNVVSPGPVWTDIIDKSGMTPPTREEFEKMTPFERVMESEEIGDIILFLSSEKAKGITGSDYVADNGEMLH